MEAALTNLPSKWSAMPTGFTGTLTEVHGLTSGTFSAAWTAMGSGFTATVAVSSTATTTGGGFTGTATGSSTATITGGGFSGTLTGSDFTGTMIIPRELFEAAARDLQRIYWDLPNIVAEFTDSRQIFDAIQDLYLSTNTPRDRQIADRITALHRAALADDEHILPASLIQFTKFFFEHPGLGLPKITLTPDGTLRARWIRGIRDFVAIEFTGEPLAKLVAEIPREDSLTAPHFASEPVKNIVSIARAIGASFA